MQPTAHQRLVREMILQLKTGQLDAVILPQIRRRYSPIVHDVWQEYAAEELLTINGVRIEVSRTGLLQVDALLPAFFEPEYLGYGTRKCW